MTNLNEKLSPTIGIDFSVKDYKIDLRNIKLQIWDLPGPERPKTITSIYFYQN